MAWSGLKTKNGFRARASADRARANVLGGGFERKGAELYLIRVLNFYYVASVPLLRASFFMPIYISSGLKLQPMAHHKTTSTS